jgi:hypothetical protein
MKRLIVCIALCAGPFGIALADGEECSPTAATRAAAAAQLKKADALEKSGKHKAAYDIVHNAACHDSEGPVASGFETLRRKTAAALGAEAEAKGRFEEATKYYDESYDGISLDRVHMKIATAKPGDLERVRTGVGYFRRIQDGLKKGAAEDAKNMSADKARRLADKAYRSRDDAYALGSDRAARLKAIPGYLKTLQGIATKNAERYLAEDDKIFKARKTSLTAKVSSVEELGKAQSWLSVFGEERRANERAIQRGDTLLKDDSRVSLQLAIEYYQLARNGAGERKVRDKARALGDASLKKGEKKLAADYYQIAGMDDKAHAIEQAHEAETEKAEAKRQTKFKQDQKSLEKELGL